MAQKWWVLSAVACGTFMATLDSSIVTIALPTLMKEFGADLAWVKWVIISHLLAITCLLLPMGRLSDLYGRKRIFGLGFILFILSSFFCGLSPSLWFLIGARIMQGIGAAMLMSNGPAIITATFPKQELGKALGTMAMVTSAGLISGPSIGGLLITQIGWRTVFLLNIPVGIAGIYLVFKNVLADPIIPVSKKFDWKGAFLQFVGINTFIIVFDPQILPLNDNEIFSKLRIALIGLAVFCGVAFLLLERKCANPLIDLSILKIRPFWSGNLAAFLTFVAFSSVSVLMPFFLEEVMRYSPPLVGLIMTTIPLTVFVVAPISGRLADRYGSFGFSVAGTAVGAVGLLLMSGYIFGQGIQTSVSQASLILVMSCIGLATGLFQSPNNISIMTSVPTEKLGAASAMIATVRNLGLVTGAGFSTDLFLVRYQNTSNFIDALHFTHFLSGLVALGAVAASFGKIGQKPLFLRRKKNG